MDDSVRDLINARRAKMLTGTLTLDDTATLLTDCAALLGNVSEEILEAGQAYALRFKEIADADITVAKAKVIAETTPEYWRLQRANKYREVLLEMLRSLKYRFKALQAEKEGASVA
jgi:hypothetical protein